jgi:hypothetical protein
MPKTITKFASYCFHHTRQSKGYVSVVVLFVKAVPVSIPILFFNFRTFSYSYAASSLRILPLVFFSLVFLKLWIFIRILQGSLVGECAYYKVTQIDPTKNLRTLSKARTHDPSVQVERDITTPVAATVICMNDLEFIHLFIPCFLKK